MYNYICMECPKQANPETKQINGFQEEKGRDGGEEDQEMTISTYRVSFGGNKNVLELNNFVNMLKPTELYTLKR